MKINNNKPLDLHDVTLKGNVSSNQATKGKPNESSSIDKVDFSSRAKELAALKEEALKIPEVRTDKVKAISDQIKAGTYDVNPQKIAGKMIDEIV